MPTDEAKRLWQWIDSRGRDMGKPLELTVKFTGDELGRTLAHLHLENGKSAPSILLMSRLASFDVSPDQTGRSPPCERQEDGLDPRTTGRI
jgi:hypothetical protein